MTVINITCSGQRACLSWSRVRQWDRMEGKRLLLAAAGVETEFVPKDKATPNFCVCYFLKKLDKKASTTLMFLVGRRQGVYTEQPFPQTRVGNDRVVCFNWCFNTDEMPPFQRTQFLPRTCFHSHNEAGVLLSHDMTCPYRILRMRPASQQSAWNSQEEKWMAPCSLTTTISLPGRPRPRKDVNKLRAGRSVCKNHQLNQRRVVPQKEQQSASVRKWISSSSSW